MPRNHAHRKLGTINVRTGKEDQKLEQIIREIRKANLTICGLQEVRRIKTGSVLIQNEGNKYEIYWSGHSLKRIHGVGIVFKTDKHLIVEEVINVNARIIVADVNVKGCSLRIINCYAPTEEDSESSKNLFYTTLKKQFSVEKPRKVICMGDFNATTSAAWYNSSLRENVIIDNLEVNDNGQRFHDFFNNLKLSVLNTWFTHKKCRRITWHSPDGRTKKVYDFVLSCSWTRQYVKNCRVYNSFDFDSDHRFVAATLKTPTSKIARFVKRKIPKISKPHDLSVLKDETVAENFKAEAINRLDTIDINVDNNTLNSNLVQAINEAGTNTLPRRTNESLHQPWHDDDRLNELFSLKDKLTAENANMSSIKAVRKKIRHRAKYLKNEYLKREADKINQ